jgi:hypothetical protein
MVREAMQALVRVQAHMLVRMVVEMSSMLTTPTTFPVVPVASECLLYLYVHVDSKHAWYTCTRVRTMVLVVPWYAIVVQSSNPTTTASELKLCHTGSHWCYWYTCTKNGTRVRTNGTSTTVASLLPYHGVRTMGRTRVPLVQVYTVYHGTMVPW